MLYALLIHSARKPGETLDDATYEAMLVEHRALQRRTRQADVFHGSARLVSVSQTRAVTRTGTRLFVTDGPFAETKEWLAGFYLLECADADEAVRHARTICLEEGQTVEVREVDWHAFRPAGGEVVDPADPARYSLIGHREVDLWHPHDPGAIEALVDAAKLTAAHHVLDVGCGRAEVALRIVERTGASVTAVDVSPAAIREARRAAIDRDPAARLTLRCAAFDPSRQPVVDLAVCVGSTHALGGLAGTLDALDPLVASGGRILVGEGYWISPPDPAYLSSIFGGDPAALPTRAEVEAMFTARGWRVRACHMTSVEGRADYEERHNGNVTAWRQVTDAADAEQIMARSNRWFDAWSRWGRETLGFGLWLIERAG